MKKVIQSMLAVAMLEGMAANVPAQTGTVTFEWTVPTTGTVATHYEAYAVTDTLNPWDSQVASANVTTNQASLVIPNDLRVFVRVRALDADNKIGPFSVFSDPYFYASPPGACGKPRFKSRS